MQFARAGCVAFAVLAMLSACGHAERARAHELEPSAVNAFIDPIGVPFTAAEIEAALRKVLGRQEAREIVAAIEANAQSEAETRGTYLTEDLLDLLASLSDDMADRVAAYREKYRR